MVYRRAYEARAGAPWPVQSFVGKFKDEFVAKGVDDEVRRAAAKNAGSTAEMKIAASPTG